MSNHVRSYQTPDTTPNRSIRIYAVVATIVATLAIWIIAVLLMKIDLPVHLGPGIQHVGALAVIITSLIAGLAAWGTLAALERMTTRPRTIWVTLAVILLLLSLAGPLGSATTTTAKIALSCMHLAAGAILIPTLARTSVQH